MLARTLLTRSLRASAGRASRGGIMSLSEISRQFCEKKTPVSGALEGMDLDALAREWRKTMRTVRKEDPMDVDPKVRAKIAEVKKMAEEGKSVEEIKTSIEAFEKEMKEIPPTHPFTLLLWACLGGLTIYSGWLLNTMFQERKERLKQQAEARERRAKFQAERAAAKEKRRAQRRARKEAQAAAAAAEES
uniref:Uncharacterized protein n=1 Tax=Lotharella globosa TaxID=91324 RepID=A0A7S3YRB8_9EUKA